MRSRNSGFSYLIVLFVVAIMGAGMATLGTLWHTASVRAKEAELLWTGGAIRAAIASYYERSPGGAKRYPPSLQDLVVDPRFPTPVRHLRRIYRDPITGTSDWGLVPAPGGGIMGVYSQIEAAPLKRADFVGPDRVFEERTVQQKEKMTYLDWQFVYLPGTNPGAGRALPQGGGADTIGGGG